MFSSIDLSINLLIILATVGLSIYCFERADLKYRFIFSPYQVVHNNKWYKLFTHAFIHADWMHLIFNMYVLYIFGTQVERDFVSLYGIKGEFIYAFLYLGGILFASIPALQKHRDNDLYLSLGASGAVSAVLFSAIILRPEMSLGLLFIPIPIPAVIFGPLYLLVEYYLGKQNRGRIAHDAHFAGAVFGIIFTLILDFNFFINNFIIQVQSLLN